MYEFSNQKTNQYSFILKTSTIEAGIGVFIIHDIDPGVKLFISPKNFRPRYLKGHQIPEPLKMYCVAKDDDWYSCPSQFNRMEIGWFINHSFEPNIGKNKKGLFSLRKISAGEEIFLDYNILNEPVHKKESYYINQIEK